MTDEATSSEEDPRVVQSVGQSRMTLTPMVTTAVQDVPARLSDVLRRLESGMGERVTLGDLVAGLRDRSFAPLLVLFSVPNVFLYLPGSSVITGLPLMLLSIQLIFGRQVVWLPRVLNERSINRSMFSRIVRNALPWVERIERLARPRLWPNAPLAIERTVGIAVFVMALLLFLPIPFANGIPALAIIAFGLALSERDGLWLFLGFAGTVFGIVFVAAIIGGGAFAVFKVFS